MSSENPALSRSEKIVTGRLRWVGLLAVIASVVGTGILRTLAVNVFDIDPRFSPLTWPQLIFVTTAGAVGAVIVFGVVVRRSKNPTRTYFWIAAVTLVVSWLPDLGMLAGKLYPGTTVQAVGTLMVGHVVVAAICVGLLTTLTREK